MMLLLLLWLLLPSLSHAVSLTIGPGDNMTASINQLIPGDTLTLTNGTYAPILIDCNGAPNNGTSTQPITIRAQNERQAHLQSDGSQGALVIYGCSYWVFQGLYATSADYAGGGSSWQSVVEVTGGSHLTFRRLLLAYTNRNQNVHLLSLTDVDYSLLEENEGYFAHRHGIMLFSGSPGYSPTGNTLRRNYFHSRDYPGDSADPFRGDTGFSCYPCNTTIVENNIFEDWNTGMDLQAKTSAIGNQYYGNITLNNPKGVVFNVRIDYGNSLDSMPQNTQLTNHLSIGDYEIGGYFRGNKNTHCDNCTFIDGTGTGFAADVESGYTGDGAATIYGKNILIMNKTIGFEISGQSDWSFDHIIIFGNGTPASPALTDSHYTNILTSDPNLGTCKVFIPTGSPAKGAGQNGADIGANILYRYQDGVLTSQPLWDPTTSQFPCGAIVAGVNDSAGDSCFDVRVRLNVNANGCTLPSAGPTPSQLVFSVQPQTTPVGQTLPAIQVQLQDSSGNLISSATNVVMIALTPATAIVPFGSTSVVFVDSQNTGYDGPRAVDNNPATFWHTDFSVSSPPPPHEIQVNLGADYALTGMTYLPRPSAGGDNGNIGQYEVYTSLNGSTWGTAAATGTWPNDFTEKTVTFSERQGHYLRLRALTAANAGPYTAAAELRALYTTGMGTGTLAGTVSRGAVGGIATFNDLSINAGGTYTLMATVSGLPSTTSTVFQQTVGPTHLRFTAQPQTVLVGQTLPPITVQFEDGANNLFATTQTITVALGANPGGSTLNGTLTQAAVGGIATFSDLALTAAASSYTLVASATGMTSDTSSLFGILGTPAVSSEWAARGTAPLRCATVGGDTNASTVGAGTDFIHNLACTLPANSLQNGAQLKTCVLAQMTTETPPQAFFFKLRAEGITLAAPANSATPEPGLTNRTSWLCWLTTIAGSPGASVPTYSASLTPLSGTMASGTKNNGMLQPVNVATNAATNWTLASTWVAAGSGQNLLTPLALTMEVLRP
jgi:hypothetical protein